MNTDLLNDEFCSINSFPVINRRLNKFSYRLQENLNIIPLNSDDIFFDMKIVYGSDGTIFQSKPLTNYNKLEGGSYTLRHGGVGRFDSRSASEMVNHLSDLLRDESAAFSIIGNEFLASDIRQLNQIIASLEQKTGKEIKYKETISYLMIRSRGQGENIFIEFWTLGLCNKSISIVLFESGRKVAALTTTSRRVHSCLPTKLSYPNLRLQFVMNICSLGFAKKEMV